MPATTILRSPATERPQSSGNVLRTSQNESFPMLDSFRQPLPRYNASQFPQQVHDSGFENGRGSTPTPSRYASRTSRYQYDTTRGLPYEARSPDMPRLGRGRPASNTFSEAMSQQRLHRIGGHDVANEGRVPNHEHAALYSPVAPSGQRRSDPETESAGSVTAPSTVWDELDDLKSRIRSLEITGKTPSTSAAAIANHAADRPRTATTAPTTISSSPRQVRKNSVARSEITVGNLATADVHPLLHDALSNAKPLINPALYRALEATAADALALAVMTGSSGQQATTYSAASIVNGVNVSDRQIRRKADSMCRNVTDLCIALCEGKSEQPNPAFRPSPATTFRFQGNTPPSQYTAKGSIEANDYRMQPSPGRTFSRLDTRRSSMLGLGLTTTSSPREMSEQFSSQEPSPSTQSQVDYAARYNRPGTSMLRARYADDPPEDPTIRAPSRAMTEVGQLRQRRSDNINTVQPRSPGLREALAARRTTLGIPEEMSDEQSESPSGSTYTGSFLQRHRPSPSDTGALTPNKRRRRITSLEQYSSPTTRFGNEPVRTTSLSRRRDIISE